MRDRGHIKETEAGTTRMAIAWQPVIRMTEMVERANRAARTLLIFIGCCYMGTWVE